jgi:hypothetical protein
MPFYAATDGKDHWSRVILWPLVWLREHRAPPTTTRGTWLLPLYWRTRTRRLDGSRASHTHFFPLLSLGHDSQAERHTVRFPDPLPFRLDGGEGYRELYDFLWNVYTRDRRGEGVRVATPANLLCHDKVDGTTTWSLPFLGHLETTSEGRRTLRLFHLIPVRF